MTDYRRLAEELIEARTKQGLPREEAYRAALDFAKGIHKALLEMRLSPVAEFREYMLAHGIQHNGEWYVRCAWLNPQSHRSLEAEGIIAYAGTLAQLRSNGIQVPKNQSARAKFYKVDQNKLKIGV